MNRALIVFVLLSVGLVACGDDGKKKLTNPGTTVNNTPNNNPNNKPKPDMGMDDMDPTPSDMNNNPGACVGTAIEAESFVERQYAKLCQTLLGCTANSQAAFDYFALQGISSAADCERLLAAQLGSPKQHASALTQGKLTFDKCLATECETEALADLQCGDVLRYIPSNIDTYRPFAACTDAFAGKAASGQSCTINGECGDGLSCQRDADIDGPMMVACAGTCKPEIDQIEGTCDPSFCKADQYCGDPDNGICFPRKADGDACEPGQCGFSSICDPGTNKCVANQGALAAGTSCDYESKLCAPGLICDGADTMSCIALYALGEDCPGFACAYGLACDPDTNKCVDAAPAGAACSLDAQCQSQRCANGTCADVNALCP